MMEAAVNGDEAAAIASDGTPNPPQQVSRKKGKKSKPKSERTPAGKNSNSREVDLTGQSPDPRQPGDKPPSAKKQKEVDLTGQSPDPRQPGDKPPSAKKQKEVDLTGQLPDPRQPGDKPPSAKKQKEVDLTGQLPDPRQPGDKPPSAKKQKEVDLTGQLPDPRQPGDKPPSAKKQKEGKKKPEQLQSLGQGEGQAQGEAVQAPQKSKAELKAERRAVQEAQRAKKAETSPAAASLVLAKAEVPRVPAKVLRDDPSTEKREEKKLAKQNVPQRASTTKKVVFFNHLNQYDMDLKTLGELLVWHDRDAGSSHGIHPAVSRLGLQYADHTISGSNARAVALLAAFEEVIWDYSTPKDKDLCRDLDAHIKRLISFLDQCRPLSVSMGNAIKFLKWRISHVPPFMAEEEAKKDLIFGIRNFIKEKISKANQAICMYAKPIIQSSEVIIVYGYSSVVFNVLRRADNGHSRTVLVVDNRPWHEGRKMLKALHSLGIKCVFVPFNLASFYIKTMCLPRHCKRQKTRLLLGAHGVLNNAYVKSRIGTAMLTCIARAYNIPVFVCFETYKISERAQADSFVFNELGNAEELEVIGHQPAILSNWKDQKTLNLLNLMYDVTPNSYFTTFITEIGLIPDTSVPKVLNTRVSLDNKDPRPAVLDEIKILPDTLILRRQSEKDSLHKLTNSVQ